MPMARMVAVLSRSLIVTSLLAVVQGAAPTPARGTGFLLFEQSGRAMGSAYAGEGAVAMDPTTVFYNPAGMTFLPGTQFASSGFAIWTRSYFHNNGSRLNEAVGGEPLMGKDGGNGGGLSLVPTFFLTHQLHERVSVGIGVSTPFGLQTDWPRGWVGRYNARLSELQTLNVNPSLAVKVADWLSIGAGANAEWAYARLANNLDMGSLCQIVGAQQGLPPAACVSFLGLKPQKVNGYVRLRGDDWSAAYNIGLLFTPLSGTRIGLTYRSRIDHTLTGDAFFTIPKKAQVLSTLSGALKNTPANASVTLPDRAAISLFQKITDQWDFLADVTWTNWSLFDKLQFNFANPKQPSVVEPERWIDSLRYALGVVYTPSTAWSFRTGYAFDPTSVPNPTRRTARIPDSDRHWLAVGFGYTPTTQLRVDLSYAHIFSPNAPTNNPDPITGARTIGHFSSAADLFSFQLTYLVDWTFSNGMLGAPTQ
jgi:long-chain fatty acid transport protein